MKTIKLPYKANNEFKNLILRLMNQCATVKHFAYNRCWEGLSEKDIRHLTINNIDLLDSWYINCLIKSAMGLYKKDSQKDKPTKTVFGGKKNFNLFAQGKISKEEFKYNRLESLISYGEACKKGNRKLY